MDIAAQMLLFAEVGEHGSFSAVARDHAQSASAISKRIAALEDHLGVRLLTRGKTGVTLTSEGEALYARCRDLARRVAEAEAEMRDRSSRPYGTLRVVSTVAFGTAQLIPALPAFMSATPGLAVSLDLTDGPIDFAADHVDVAVRFSEQIDDETIIARRLAANERVLCASPAYLNRAGTPAHPTDFAAHNCLRLSTVARWNDWGLYDDTGAPVPVRGNFEAGSADAIYAAALAGLGIARLSTYLVARDLAEGRLVRLLPDYVQRDASIVALYPDRRNLSPNVRAFIDFFAARFAGGFAPAGHAGAAPDTDAFGGDDLNAAP
jgi:DNA-binding transcriptional LysR family regulator